MRSKKYSQALFLVLLCLLLISSVSLASSLDRTNPNTDVSGWDYSTQEGHMGTKYSTFTYSSSEVQSKYGLYIIGGINMWGSHINMNYVSQYSEGMFYAQLDTSRAPNAATIADTLVLECNSEGHRIGYLITIYPSVFDTLTDSKKVKTIAHEIGHAYGLGHAPSSSSIMYGYVADSMSITSQDVWGMKIVTHQHTHSASTTGTYKKLNPTYHYVTCDSCYGIYKQEHSFSSAGTCTKCGFHSSKSLSE